MAALLYNMARMTTATTGTGTITLGSAVASFLTFAQAGVQNLDVVSYVIEDGNGTAREVGTGTYTSSGTTLSRTPVNSTNSNAAINLSGTAQVAITALKADIGSGYGSVTSITENGVTITSSGTLPPSYGLQNHSLAVSASGSALTIALKDNAGSDPSSTSPVNGWFRNVTGTTGSWTQLTVTGALSLVVSSGSTLGVTNSTAFRLWVVLFNDGGTARLGVINCSTSSSTAAAIYPLNEGIPASSTQEGGAGAADSAGVFYTGTAVASKSYLIVGYIEWDSTGLTAGTWTTSHVLYVQSFGPGIKKPGDIMQTAQMSTTSVTTSTANTFASTNTTLAITPTSAANLIRVVAFGCGTTANALNSNENIALFRGSTQLTPLLFAIASTGTAATTAAFDWLDGPNSNSSTTYTVKIANDDNATTIRFPVNVTGATGVMVLNEIMG